MRGRFKKVSRFKESKRLTRAGISRERQKAYNAAIRKVNQRAEKIREMKRQTKELRQQLKLEKLKGTKEGASQLVGVPSSIKKEYMRSKPSKREIAKIERMIKYRENLPLKSPFFSGNLEITPEKFYSREESVNRLLGNQYILDRDYRNDYIGAIARFFGEEAAEKLEQMSNLELETFIKKSGTEKLFYGNYSSSSVMSSELSAYLNLARNNFEMALQDFNENKSSYIDEYLDELE